MRSEVLIYGASIGCVAGALCAVLLVKSAISNDDLDRLQIRAAALAAAERTTPRRPAGLAATRMNLLTVGAPGPGPGEISLKGTVIAGGKRSALLSIRNSEPVWITPGEETSGATLRDVQRDAVKVEVDGQILVIALQGASPPNTSFPQGPTNGNRQSQLAQVRP